VRKEPLNKQPLERSLKAFVRECKADGGMNPYSVYFTVRPFIISVLRRGIVVDGQCFELRGRSLHNDDNENPFTVVCRLSDNNRVVKIGILKNKLNNIDRLTKAVS